MDRKTRILELSKKLKPIPVVKQVSLAEQLGPVLETLIRAMQKQDEILQTLASKDSSITFPEQKEAQITVNVPEHKNPEITVNVPEIQNTMPALDVNFPEPAREWEFTILRHDNGLINSITAKRNG